MSDEFSFNGGMRGPWFTTSAEDVTLATASEDFGRSDWNEWMQWDPASAQSAEVKPLNAQGPICYLKPGQKPPIVNRRQNSQVRNTALRLQSTNSSINMSGPQENNVPAYAFGGSAEQPPPFQFENGSLSSPSVHDGQQQTGFYSPQGWDQRQEGSANSLFSPVGVEPPHMGNGGHNPASSTPSLHHSPDSLNQAHTSSSSLQSSPEPGQTNNAKKRKSSAVDVSAVTEKKDKPPPVKKTAHNMIEKRYRTNLNDKIAALRDSVPSLRVMSRGNGDEEDDPEDLEGLTPAHKLNKATVLSKATEYIRHLEKRNKRLQEELNACKARLENYEKMAMTGTMALAGAVNTPDGNRYTDDPFGANPVVGQSVSNAPQGMIPVPESMANLHRGIPPQPHYAPQSYPVYSTGAGRPALPGPPLINSRHRNSVMGKLMVGSLAGLMVLEGLVEREESGETPQGRGLLALPFNLANIMTSRVSVGGTSTQLPLAKLLLVFGALFYIIAPLFESKPKRSKKNSAAIVLSPAPSLASPVEVRRKAWLTAIQTVWVPRHNFILELAALCLKTLKLSTRSVIGWQGYSMLTGATKDQEIARVKAWDIALDAQLTGGDAEISKSRLILTLLASGTLPDTPIRLMLKALHIRVLLWEVSNCGCGTWYVFKDISTKLARRYWNAARHQQKIATNSTTKADSETEKLPEHLAALLLLECDDVLIDIIVQRAYKLAWNKPSAESTSLDVSMDSVVEDFTISSPLDALAAWWSSYTLNKALVGYLRSKNSVVTEKISDCLDLALRTAPPASQAQLRALVAKSVVLNDNRASHIAAAFEALPAPLSLSSKCRGRESRSPLMNLVGTSPVADDIANALTLAKCLSLVESSDARARLRGTFAVNTIYLPPATMTLLSCVAAYKLFNTFLQNPVLENEARNGLEHLVCSVRIWVGQEAGRRSGLSNKLRGRIVEHCLDISKKLVGLAQVEESDAGYVSQDTSD